MTIVKNPHDSLFRNVLSDRTAAADFLRNFLPQEILQAVDISSLDIAKDTFVEGDLRNHFSDLLYRIGFASGETGYLYLLFEHKSNPPKGIHLQLHQYMDSIWELHSKQHSTQILPIILPLVLYHGQRNWPAPLRFSRMLSGPVENFSRYIPDFEYVMIDLSSYSDDQIRGVVFFRAAMLLLKHVFDPNIREKLPEIFALMRELLFSESGLHALKTLLSYIYKTVEGITEEDVVELLDEPISDEKESIAMTIAEKLRKEGIEIGHIKGFEIGHMKGKEEGKVEGVREGLIEAIELGLSLRFGEKGLSLLPKIRRIRKIERLRALLKAIHTSGDINEFERRI